MIRVLLVLGLVACDREAREGAAPAPSPASRPARRPSPPPARPALAPVEDVDDADIGPSDDEDTAADDDATDNEVADHRREAVAVADHPAIGDEPPHRAIAGDDNTTDRDTDDIADELDKCPDVPDDSDEDIDGCPDVVPLR